MDELSCFSKSDYVRRQRQLHARNRVRLGRRKGSNAEQLGNGASLLKPPSVQHVLIKLGGLGPTPELFSPWTRARFASSAITHNLAARRPFAAPVARPAACPPLSPYPAINRASVLDYSLAARGAPFAQVACRSRPLISSTLPPWYKAF
jgi:hypothetical protein